MMNQFFLDGYLMDEVTLQQSEKTGRTYCRGAISVGYRTKDKEGTGISKYVSNIFPFILFGQPAEYLAKYGKKGDRMNLIGTMSTSSYTLDVVDKESADTTEKTIRKIDLIGNDVTITHHRVQEVEKNDNNEQNLIEELKDASGLPF